MVNASNCSFWAAIQVLKIASIKFVAFKENCNNKAEVYAHKSERWNISSRPEVFNFIENITERGLVKEIVFSLTAQLLNACFKTKCLAVEKQAAIAVVFFVARMSPD